MISLGDVKKNKTVKTYIKKANETLGVIGYTEHGERHSHIVSRDARKILKELGRDERLCELAAIAGCLHDIGNVISRDSHAQTGAIIAHMILTQMDMDINDVAEVIAAIGNHHEEDGLPVSDVTAALILADKADVHRSRVRNPKFIKFDIHDRVNYSTESSTLRVERENKVISLDIAIDTGISSVMEYFEIFLSRMTVSRKAADFLGCRFNLIINGGKMI
ncbi:phosphohydrolase [candidate division WOR-3 bacterium JGI_Cruoil_03_44_89]|uniref:Phosphohydrolase n=1 Tax=candidate division WOR-3 bacterium JGI_Cruoil_03_44_89 TaxID=1973748 RepID=A0A235BNG6_UNCW3|nr:MAG: phosphohydrolase [candidate division WOR-3 bacterium JGI_Cruoil_03_44_89]